jgi:tetratricopeptide (TPR) repeat protein
LQARHLYYGQAGNFTEFEEEIGLLRSALERDPQYVPAMTLLVQVLGYVPIRDDAHRAAKAEERMQLIRDAYAIDPDDANANLLMGWNVMVETGDLQESVKYVERSLQLGPSNVEVLRTAAFVSGDLGRVDDAVMLLREALIREPLCIPCFSMLGRILAEDHRWEEAEEVLRRRIALIDDVGGHINLANVLLNNGRAEEALAIIDEWEPNEGYRLGLRSRALDKLGRHEEADENIAQMREQYEDDPMLLGRFYAQRGDVEQTLHWLGVALDQNPGVFTFMVRDRSFSLLRETPEWHQWLEAGGYNQEYMDSIEFEIPDFDR